MPSNAVTTRRLLDFELGLAAAVADDVVEADWGRAILCPSLPRVYDASLLSIEVPGLEMREVVSLADELLGGAGIPHRTVLVADEAESARLAGELEQAPGWKAEWIDYMVWERECRRRPAAEVREAGIERAAALRAELIAEWLPEGRGGGVETVAQLVELGRRDGPVAGDRWFLAPAAEPAAACCLLGDGAIGQVEDVGTLERARGQGLAQAVVLAALAASQAAGHELTFIAADAEDWPRLLYNKLGFRKVGENHLLRWLPT